MSAVSRIVIALALLAGLWPGSVAAQTTKAGVVTTLEGHVTAARSTAAQPVALKFKDDVFVNDRVVTGDRSLARLLLGGKAVVTVRERSALTITEVPGRSTIDLDSGKIAVAVAKDRMQPGEQIEVKTPNAVAAVRGTAFVVEVIRASTSADSAQAGVTVNHYVFVGQVTVMVGAQVITVGPNSFASVTGGVVNSGLMTGAMRANATSGFTPSGLPKVSGADSDAKQAVMNTTIATFTAATLPFVTPPPAPSSPPPAPLPTPFPGSNSSGPTPEQLTTIANATNGGSSSSGGAGSGSVVISSQSLVLTADQSLKTFSGQSASSSPNPAVSVTNSTVSGPDNMIVVDPGANASLAGALLTTSGSAAMPTSLAANQAIVDIRGVIASTTASAFVSADPTFFSAPNFLRITGGSLSLAGPLLADLGGVYAISGDFLSVSQGGSLTASTNSPLMSFSGSAVAIGVAGSQTQNHLLNLGGSDSKVSLGGSLASLTNGSVLVLNGAPGSALIATAPGVTFTSPSTSPLVSLTGSALGLGAGVRGLVETGGTVSIGGPLFTASAGSVIASDPTVPLVELSGASLTVPGTLVRLQGGSSLVSGVVRVTNGSLTADSLVSTDGAGNTIQASGPVLDLTNATVTLRKLDDRPSSNTDTAVLLLSLNQPAFRLTSSQLTLTGGSGPAVTLGQISGPVTANPGVAIVGTGTANAPSSISLSRPLLGIAPVTLTGTQPLLQFDHTTINQAAVNQAINDLILVVGTSALPITSTGQFLAATDSVVNAGGGSLVDFAGGSVTSATTSPLLFFDPSTVTTALNLVGVINGSSLRVAGALLSTTNSTLNIGGDVVGVFNGSTLSSTTTNPLIQVAGGTLTTNTALGLNGSALDVGGLGGPNGNSLATVTLNGPLLAASGSGNGPLNLAGGLVNVFGGGTVVLNGEAAGPLTSITGGTSSLGTSPGSAMFRLFGTATALDGQSGLVLGTDRPLQGSLQADGTRPVPGSLLQTSGATVTGQRLLNIDTALLEATAPLFNATAQSVSMSALDAINLANRANLLMSQGTDLVRFDASQLTVNSGSLVNVSASKLTVGGNLVTMLNGAMLTLLNGPLITVSNGGFVSITGSLINFGGTGENQVRITNSFCPCVVIGGIPVALQNGALAANVQITNPIKNNGTLGALTLSPNAALAVVNGAASKLTVSGH